MIKGGEVQGFINTLTAQTANLNAAAAVDLMVRTAIEARDRVLRGRPTPSGYRQIVDGVNDAPLTAVRPDGQIVFAWQYLREVAEDTYHALVNRAPRDSGAYRAGIIVLIDGAGAGNGWDSIDINTRRVQIVASVPYARRLEIGKTKTGRPWIVQVRPNIVSETATSAKKLWADVAAVYFNYVDLTDAPLLKNPKGWRKSGFRAFKRHGIGTPVIHKNVKYPAIIIEPRVS